MMERQTAGELGELLAQDQPAAMETRFQRLILHVQNGARLFSRESFEVSEDDWRAGRFPLVPGDSDEFIPLPQVATTVSYP